MMNGGLEFIQEGINFTKFQMCNSDEGIESGRVVPEIESKLFIYYFTFDFIKVSSPSSLSRIENLRKDNLNEFLKIRASTDDTVELLNLNHNFGEHIL